MIKNGQNFLNLIYQNAIPYWPKFFQNKLGQKQFGYKIQKNLLESLKQLQQQKIISLLTVL